MTNFQPDPPVEGGRVFVKLSRGDLQSNVGALDAGALGNAQGYTLQELLVRKKDGAKSLTDGTGYDVAELLVRRIERNLSRGNGRATNLAALVTQGIHVFGFEVVVDPSAGPAPFANHVAVGRAGLQVVWLTNAPQGQRGPHVYVFANYGTNGPVGLSTDPPAPLRGSPGRFFVAHRADPSGGPDPSDWEAVLPTAGIDTPGSGGLTTGEGAASVPGLSLFVDPMGWYYFTVDLRFSLREFVHGGTELLYTEECFVETQYDEHPWLMGKLGLTNPPVDGATTNPSPWVVPTHDAFSSKDVRVPTWGFSGDYDSRSADDVAFDSFVEVSGTDFVVDGEPLSIVGGNHPDLRTKGPQRMAAWFDQWGSAIGKLNVLRATAFGSGTPTGTDCLPLVPDPPTQSGGSWVLDHSDAAFRRLDDLVYRCGKHGVRLILPLGNYRDWQGGFQQWVEWATAASGGSDPDSKEDFYSNALLEEWYKAHVDAVLEHENTFTGVKYRNDPTIMLWELANEPRAPGAGSAFVNWVQEMSDHVKGKFQSEPHEQLVSIGGGDQQTVTSHYDTANGHGNVDAWSTHVWADPPHANVGIAGGETWIDNHATAASNHGMPVYVGELGWRVQRSAGSSASQMTKRNDALKQWFPKVESETGGGLVWELRLLEEHATLRDLEAFGADSYDVYPSDADTVTHIG